MMREAIYQDWHGKRVAVIGLGVSNVPLIHFLQRYGATISGRDRQTADALGERYHTLSELGIELVLGDEYLVGLESYDAVFLAPGVPKWLPEIMSLAGKKPLLSEISLVLK